MTTKAIFLLALMLFPLSSPAAPSSPRCGIQNFDELLAHLLKGGEKLEVGKIYWHRTDGEVEVVALEQDGGIQVRLSNGDIRDYDPETAATLESCRGPSCG